MINNINSTNLVDSGTLREPDMVMNPSRLGAMHQSRLSFVRSLVRRMARQKWTISQSEWALDGQGFGHVIYRIETLENHYHLLIFSDEIANDERNDRVIAEKWDITFALVQGDVDSRLFARLKDNVPLQEAGRNCSQVLVLARANKSMRVFEHLVDSLSSGMQPQRDILASVGYILRTTAVYGNGKFGIADFEVLKENLDFELSFSAQMCAVYVLRQFSLDWVHYLAKQRGGDQAVELIKPLQRYLGVGNATGLGMVPYLINHPKIIDRWLSQREYAIAATSCQPLSQAKNNSLIKLLKRAVIHLQQVITIDTHQQEKNRLSVQELDTLISGLTLELYHQWQTLIQYIQSYSYESQEIVITCMLELYPDLVDKYEFSMNADEALCLRPGLLIEELLQILQHRYCWALNIDFSLAKNSHWFWYRSKDKEEPRMGVRGEEPGDEQEMSLDIARQVSHLQQALISKPIAMPVSEFLLEQPQYRSIARRVWAMSQCPMGDIQVNLLDKETLPMDLLRCKLAMFGATKFDPRSDRWVRVTLFQGAPMCDELHTDEWLFPVFPQEGLLQNQPPQRMPLLARLYTPTRMRLKL
ncbi:hypothetical protein [Shewanella sp.]|uniref:hypothetical protein n=1 Tax=Shewanella sp. TaxID=50422 RepID=UPI0025860DC5|nr:hypothetical protein [Shewanella sp.]MCJ8303913.1 hypothetical protein [Shewanella sp.]